MKFILKTLAPIGVLALSATAMAMSPARSHHTLDCSQADESSFVVKTYGGFEYAQIKVAENASTGYRWISNIQLPSEYVSNCKKPTPGCGGVRTLTLDPLALEEQGTHKSSKKIVLRLQEQAPGNGEVITKCTVTLVP